MAKAVRVGLAQMPPVAASGSTAPGTETAAGGAPRGARVLEWERGKTERPVRRLARHPPRLLRGTEEDRRTRRLDKEHGR